MVQVKCHCGRTATMSHPTDWVCQCQIEALYEEFDKMIAALREKEADVTDYAQRNARLIPAIDRVLAACDEIGSKPEKALAEALRQLQHVRRPHLKIAS